jgi:hypothetical protein
MDAEVEKQDIYLLKGTVRLAVQSCINLMFLSNLDHFDRPHKSNHVARLALFSSLASGKAWALLARIVFSTPAKYLPKERHDVSVEDEGHSFQ